MMRTYIYAYEDPGDDHIKHLEVEYDTRLYGPDSITILLVCDVHGNEMTEDEWKRIINVDDLKRRIARTEND